MREIKFRGKIVDANEWIFGYYHYLCRSGTHCIDVPMQDFDNSMLWHVIPTTVGQYTGLRDKNGKEIYEGDIVLATLKFFNINNEKCKVIFHNGSFGVQYGFSTDYFKTFSAWDEVEVIGNIHDNPELLEVK